MTPSRASVLFPALALSAALTGCGPTAPTTPADDPLTFTGPGWFADATADAGLDFVNDPGPTDRSYFMPQIMGSGAALFDFNNDGLLDILLLQDAGPDSPSRNRLYQQLPGGTFKDVSKGSGLDVAGYNLGVAIGDVNNDGLPDVLITQFGGVKLFLNLGDGKFRDVTKESGLDAAGWATSACFFDYDRDGFLDLAVPCYADYDRTWTCKAPNGEPEYCGPNVFHGTVCKLFHNRGAQPGGGVRFEDATISSGLARLPGPGLGAIAADFDGDGWPDLFIADDGEPNHLWINRHDGTFKEEAVQRGAAYNGMGQADANMGVAWGDVDGDLLPDLFITHTSEERNILLKQGPRGQFRDETLFSGLGQPRWNVTGFGTVMGDFDNAGALDVAVVNGHIYRAASYVDNPELTPYWRPYAQRNQLFANDGAGRFRDVSTANAPFCQTPRVSRGLCVGDVFNDGSLALLATEIGGPARLFRNVAADRGHWLEVRALDPRLKRDAYGAEVTVKAAGRRQMRLVSPAGSYLCSTDPRAHFGLGKATNVEEVQVLWPDGLRERFVVGEVDRRVELRRGEGRAVEKES